MMNRGNGSVCVCVGTWNGYLRTQGLQLHGGHAHQLHALLVVGDGAGQVGDLRYRNTRYTKRIESVQDRERAGVKM